MQLNIILFSLVVLLLGQPAYAYIGPGAGASAIAVVVGIIAAIVLLLIAIVWYPFKRLLLKIKKSKEEVEDASNEE
ncbi:MAG: hypothetical protein MJK10_18775 [Pseudomonadales bacterium]|nr:hypothetical protein [Pseudomonadales bacterium]NRA16385.1 hypothetical protein [Oceanospirillaceae bacterium]